MNVKPLISIVIPVYNRSELLCRTVDSILKQDYSAYEIIVVDDNSTEDISSALNGYSCRLIRNKENLGPGGSRNAGARISKGDILFFTDSDVLLPPDTLSKISLLMEKKNTDGLVGLLSSQIEYDNFASNFKNLYMHHTYSLFGEYTKVFFTSVAAIQKTVFFDIGGFDEKFGLIPNEDLDFGMRLQCGFYLRFSPELEVEHVKHYTMGQVLHTGLQRGSSVARINLRLRKEMKKSHKGCSQRAYSTSYLMGILLAAMSLLAIPGLFISVFSLLLIPLCVILIAVCNYSFLAFVRRIKGAGFMVKSSLFLYPDVLSYGFGIFLGITGFISGKKY